MSRRLFAAIVVSAGLAISPAALADPVTSAFTYQGEIQKSGAPVTGNADLRFTLWDAVSGGNQIGSQINRNNVAVSGGVFTVSLDFGIDALKTGQERYLQIELRSPAGSGAFVTLSSTPAPLRNAVRHHRTRRRIPLRRPFIHERCEDPVLSREFLPDRTLVRRRQPDRRCLQQLQRIGLLRQQRHRRPGDVRRTLN
ncbi:MAG: hypothetical protein KF705_01175 [Phycisphaeraceae bacterium]|nr:hypothetical protein [Phycisphaeraceae bacterium]